MIDRKDAFPGGLDAISYRREFDHGTNRILYLTAPPFASRLYQFRENRPRAQG